MFSTVRTLTFVFIVLATTASGFLARAQSCDGAIEFPSIKPSLFETQTLLDRYSDGPKGVEGRLATFRAMAEIIFPKAPGSIEPRLIIIKMRDVALVAAKAARERHNLSIAPQMLASLSRYALNNREALESPLTARPFLDVLFDIYYDTTLPDAMRIQVHPAIAALAPSGTYGKDHFLSTGQLTGLSREAIATRIKDSTLDAAAKFWLDRVSSTATSLAAEIKAAGSLQKLAEKSRFRSSSLRSFLRYGTIDAGTESPIGREVLISVELFGENLMLNPRLPSTHAVHGHRRELRGYLNSVVPDRLVLVPTDANGILLPLPTIAIDLKIHSVREFYVGTRSEPRTIRSH